MDVAFSIKHQVSAGNQTHVYCDIMIDGGATINPSKMFNVDPVTGVTTYNVNGTETDYGFAIVIDNAANKTVEEAVTVFLQSRYPAANVQPVPVS